MIKNKVPLDLLAQQLARRNRGDNAAAHYLAALGIAAQSGIDNAAMPVAKPAAAGPVVDADVLPQPRRPAFAFDFFTLDGKQRLHDDDGPQRSGAKAFIAADDKAVGQAPAKPELESLRALLTRLQLALKQGKPGHRLAIKPLVKQIAKQQVVARMPLLPALHEPHQLTIYLDTGANLSGLATDGFMLAAALVADLSQCTSQIIVLPDGPQGRWAYLDDTQQQSGPLALPASGSACLIITGLGQGSADGWRFVLAGLAARGITPCWLSASRGPVPGQHVVWGQGRKVQQHAGAALPLLLLSVLLGSCRIITGAMLRQLIQHLELPSASETAFWQQSHVHYQSGSDSGYVTQDHNAFAHVLKSLTAAQWAAFSTLIEAHLQPIGSSALHEHRIHLSLLATDWTHPEQQDSIEFFNSLGSNLQTDDPQGHNIAQYLDITVQQYEGLFDRMAETPQLQSTLAQACAYNFEQYGDVATIPPALAQQVQDILTRKGGQAVATRPYLLAQHGNRLLSQPADEALTAPLLARVEHVPSAPWLLYPQDPLQSPLQHKPQAKQTLAASGKYQLNQTEPFVLQSSATQLHITPRNSKAFYWAKSLAVTANGVVASTDFVRVSWPTEGLTQGASRDKNGAIIEVLDHAPQWLQRHKPQLDQHGLFVEINIATKGSDDVTFTLRYIPPGSFLMGSPESEPERFEREIQHPVTLTQGYWLGQTTVTQQLWQAVMGNNPSNFTSKTGQLPVEKVSWDDCQAFCRTLNQRVPGLTVNLPTEAQWEYACRAGSQTPFSTGEQLTTDQANYNGNSPYNEGEKGQYREKTVAVKQFNPNPWGLYQMHGNVWEWCQDGWEDYRAEAAIDPIGGTDPRRVLRGGSWVFDGRHCRSAYRFYGHRGYGDGFIGLRVTQV